MCCFFHALIIQNHLPNIQFCPGLDGKPQQAADLESQIQNRINDALAKKEQQRQQAQKAEQERQGALAKQQAQILAQKEEQARQGELVKQQAETQREKEQLVSTQQSIQRLLTKATGDLKQLRLSSPKGNNAVEKYQQILQLESGNQKALQGLTSVVEKYLQLAEKAQVKQQYDKARQYINKAKNIQADNPKISQAEESLQLAEQSYKQEKLRLAEQEKQEQLHLAKQEKQKRDAFALVREKVRLAELEKQRQEALARKKAEANKLNIAMVRIAPGCFQMGRGKRRDETKHRVCLSKGYSMGKYEVTQAQWKAVMGTNPSQFKGSNKPVENVSWNDIQDFIAKLNRQSGLQYRLPTEAEWEYVCRSGGRNEKYCGGNTISSVAWYSDNSGRQTHTVGQKQANGLGLYDMSGNVWEWVSDWYDGDYYSQSPTNNPKGGSGGSHHVYRGGSWINDASYARSAYRGSLSRGYRGGSLGFRLARTNVFLPFSEF